MSDDVRLGLVVGGAVAVMLAIAWRSFVVNGRRRRLRKGLQAPDPQDRARAGILLVDEGLNRSARPLLGHVAREADPRVRHAIALAVARRQWEPVNTLRVRQLREWASQELASRGEVVSPFGPAVTRLSDMGGPRPADDRPGSKPENDRFEEEAPASEHARPSGVSWHLEDPDPR